MRGKYSDGESIGMMEYIGDVIRKIEFFFYVICINKSYNFSKVKYKLVVSFLFVILAQEIVKVE